MSESRYTRLGRRRAFSCLHFYRNDEWSDVQNLATFGACFTPHGHGHNYEIEVFFAGPIDPATGMIFNLIEIDRLLAAVLQPIEGKHLNLEVAQFSKQVPTCENLARYLVAEMTRQLPASLALTKLRLYESRDLWVDVWP